MQATLNIDRNMEKTKKNSLSRSSFICVAIFRCLTLRLPPCRRCGIRPGRRPGLPGRR